MLLYYFHDQREVYLFNFDPVQESFPQLKVPGIVTETILECCRSIREYGSSFFKG